METANPVKPWIGQKTGLMAQVTLAIDVGYGSANSIRKLSVHHRGIESESEIWFAFLGIFDSNFDQFNRQLR